MKIAALLTALPLFVVARHAPQSDRRCTQMFIPFDSAAKAIDLLHLRATPDTVFDGRYFTGFHGLQRDSTTDFRPPVDVYGHVFELEDARGPNVEVIKSKKRVVLIWWSVTPACSRDKPYTSRQHAIGTIVISKAPRPREGWIDGMPTFDMESNDWVYEQQSAKRNR